MRRRPDPPWITGLGQSREPIPAGELAQYVIVAVILLLLALAGWLYLSATVRVDTLAVTIHQLEIEKEDLRRDIVSMNAELAIKESLERVRREATRLNLTPRQAGQQLEVPNLGPDTPAQASERPQNGVRGLWQRLSGFFGGKAAEETP